jgi:hypothetical protein
MVVFPHANGHGVPDDDFRAAWRLLCARFPVDPVSHRLPRLSRRVPIASMEANGQQRSLEYLCKVLVPSGYKATAQATNSFLTVNRHVVRATPNGVKNPASDREVEGVELVGALPATVPTNIEAQFEADADLDDIKGHDASAEPEPLEWPANGENSFDRSRKVATPKAPSTSSVVLPASYIREFVLDVHRANYFPRYLGAKVPPGTAIQGWDDRLVAYFWPKPAHGIAANNATLAPLLATASQLAIAVAAGSAWTSVEAKDAVRLVRAIFAWGGVPQKGSTITPVNIRNVFDAAIMGTIAQGTLMNSGWTKVAAFATDHLPPARRHVIWDSRVSTAVVRRLDAIFRRHGLTAVPPGFQDIGLVNIGRGGTRPVRAGQLRLKWVNGYRSWSAQLAGSQFLRKVCVDLNAGVVQTTRRGHWTLRDVEMVLFGDGY